MVINRTRDLARQSICYMGASSGHASTMVRYIIAFAVAMKRHLRGERELTELARMLVLDGEQIAEIQSAKHMPLIVLEKLSATIRAAKREGLLSDIEAMALDANLTQCTHTTWLETRG
jgi:predicted membrane chloride channel (bestrophin family)